MFDVRKLWPKITKIYWDPDYDVPVVKPKPEHIDLFYVVKLTEPCDARPGFEADRERLKSSIKYEFGSDKLYRELFDRFILLNKVPHWDQMWEIVSSGNIWGQLYYNPFENKWRFRLTPQGAWYCFSNNIVDVVKTSSKISKGMVLDKSSSCNQVIVIDDRDRIIGLAERSGGKLVVSKVFHRVKPPIQTNWRKTSIDDVIKHNIESLNWFTEQSIKFIKKIHNKYKYPVIVSYSGGKDSLVALDLVVKTISNVKLLFNDTGLELPETIENVKIVSEKYGLELVEAQAGDLFWKNLDTYGPPGKDYRWCCKIAKLTPIARVTRIKWSSGALNIVGQRAFESFDRARSPIVWRNKWIPHLISTTPIQYWNQLIEWLYIIYNKLPCNPLYFEGFERLGCYMCPSGTLSEFKEVERKHCELWSKWINELEKWRIRLNQPREWIDYGLWRWVTPALAKFRLAKRLENYSIDWRIEYINRLNNSKTRLYPLKVLGNTDKLIIEFNDKLLSEQYIDSFRSNILMLKYKLSINRGELVVETKHSKITIKNNIIELEPYTSSENFEDLVDVIKIIYRVRNCSKCSSCILWCPLKIIKLTDQGPVVTGESIGCRVCLEICPISEVLVEKIVLPLITGNYKIWVRKTRRRIPSEYYLLINLSS